MTNENAAIILEVPLAGIAPENISVSVCNRTLMLKIENTSEHEIDEKDYYRKEVRSGSFYRELTLPPMIDESKVSAEFENGVLKISAPKNALPEAKSVPVKIIKK
jgi:HSP20 family protein